MVKIPAGQNTVEVIDFTTEPFFSTSTGGIHSLLGLGFPLKMSPHFDLKTSTTEELCYKTDITLSLKEGDKVYVRWYMHEYTFGKEGGTTVKNPRTEVYGFSKSNIHKFM